MSVNISFIKDVHWKSVCGVCKSYMDLYQDFNSAELHEMMRKNHEFCGQGWDKQFNLIPEKHHYLCNCEKCTRALDELLKQQGPAKMEDMPNDYKLEWDKLVYNVEYPLTRMWKMIQDLPKYSQRFVITYNDFVVSVKPRPPEILEEDS